MPISCAFIVYGPIGSGKTCTCLSLAEIARSEGLTVGGILSPRVYHGGELVGYDGLDPSTGEVFPLVRLRSRVGGTDWFIFGQLRYAFSAPGFERANRILTQSAKEINRLSIVFVDEFGRLEGSNLGIHAGASRVAEALRDGGVSVFTCRGDMIQTVEGLLRGRAQAVFRREPGGAEAMWRFVQGYAAHAD